MIRIKVKLQGVLRKDLGNQIYLTVDGEHATVGRVLENLRELNESAYEVIMSRSNVLRPCILVLNDRRVDRLENFNTRMKNGDQLTIYPPIMKKD